MADLRTRVGEVALPTPVLTASGCAAAGRELSTFVDLRSIGGVVTKSIMAQPRAGRPTPRMVETPSGMLNSIGLQGPGIEAFLADDLPWLLDSGAQTVVSIAGGSTDEYGTLGRRMHEAWDAGLRPAAVEVNISCPNVANRGLVFACDPVASAHAVSAVKDELPSEVAMWVKLSPDVTDLVQIASAAVDSGADALCLVNTTLGMAIDHQTLRPRLGGVTGGLSGPAIRPIAVRCVYQVAAAMPDVPIVGIGGVQHGWDALELMAAGASAVQVGTVIFGDPGAPVRLADEISTALESLGLDCVTDVVGAAHRED
ncbi:MAG: dihydroorotate dehydrogenase [Jiangellales bacterium]